MGESTAAVSREREVKLNSHTGFVVPPLDGLGAAVERHDPMTLTAHYYDTADLRLARWGVTLRRRTGGEDDAWTLKLPVDGARDEVTLPLDGRTRPPAELARLVTAFARGAALRQVTTLITLRTTTVLIGDEGELAEVVADAVTARSDGRETARWHEVEVEAKRDDADLEPILTALVEAGASRTAQISKAVRALGPRASTPGDPPPPPSLERDAPARLLVERELRAHTRGLVVQDPRVRLGLDDAVHQMRVSARRLRSALKTLGPLLDPSWADPLRAELAWLGSALGGSRDAEVVAALLDRCRGRLPQGIDGPDLDEALQQRLAGVAAEGVASAALESRRYVRLLNTLVDACWVPPLTALGDRPLEEVTPQLVQRTWDHLARRADQLDRRTSPPERYHRVRVLAKRARYAVDMVEPAYGKPARKLAGGIADVQTALGEHQDAAVAADILATMARQTGVSGPTAYALGHLGQLVAEEAAAARTRFHELWPEVARKRHRSWLRG